MKKLTIKQTKFIKHYFESGNGTESYKVAGYKYKDNNSAGVAAHTLLRNVKIQEAIEQFKKKAGLTDELLLKVHLGLLPSSNENIKAIGLKLAYQINGKLNKDAGADTPATVNNISITINNETNLPLTQQSGNRLSQRVPI